MSARHEHGVPIWEVIASNRIHIDAVIHQRLNTRGFESAIDITDEDRRRWIMKDEELYTWAREEGVHI